MGSNKLSVPSFLLCHTCSQHGRREAVNFTAISLSSVPAISWALDGTCHTAHTKVCPGTFYTWLYLRP